jgi:multisubunit Na+/H+ antiporter MnhG subunit
MIVLASSGFGTVLIGIIIVILESGSWMGRIVIVSGVVILLASSVVTRRLRKKIQRKLKRK